MKKTRGSVAVSKDKRPTDEKKAGGAAAVSKDKQATDEKKPGGPVAARKDGPATNGKKPQDAVTASTYEEKLKRAEALFKAAKVSPRIRIRNNPPEYFVDHPLPSLGFAKLGIAIGSTDDDFISGMITQLGNAASKGREFDEASTNFMLSVIKDIKPKDQIEAMLAAQIAAVHMAIMTSTRLLAHSETLAQMQGHEQAFNKLTRTFTIQMDALKRYRPGEPKVTVQHVSVRDGGQAIVGNVTHAGADGAKKTAPDQPLALTDARQVPMPPIEPREQVRVPVQRGKRPNDQSSP